MAERPGHKANREAQQRRIVSATTRYHSRAVADFWCSEPEFRLVFMAVALVFCTVGMFVFGYTLSVGSPSALCAFFQGVMCVESRLQ
jgi:hypothetical protein